MKQYTLEQLKELSEEYLSELDDYERDEIYDTNRGFNVMGVEGFLDWLEGVESKG